MVATLKAGLQLRRMPVENFSFWPNMKMQFSNFKKTHQDLNLFPTLFITVKTISACFTWTWNNTGLQQEVMVRNIETQLRLKGTSGGHQGPTTSSTSKSCQVDEAHGQPCSEQLHRRTLYNLSRQPVPPSPWRDLLVPL